MNYALKNSQLDNINVSEEVSALIEKGAIGNAKSYSDLLSYLAKRSDFSDSAPPGETEIAQDVFKKTDFSQLTDSSVRVYVHNLRKKLENYYLNEGSKDELIFYIPRGSYKLEWKNRVDAPSLPIHIPTHSKHLYLVIGLIAAGLSIITGITGYALGKGPPNEVSASVEPKLSHIPIWGKLRSNSYPTIIVVGELYHFKETDPVTNTTRMVRQFDINNDIDFENKLSEIVSAPGVTPQKSPLRYFGKGAVFSLPFITKELRNYTDVSLKMSSELTPDDIRQNNIIFLGHFKSLATLQDIYKGTPYQLEQDFAYLRDKRDSKAYYVQGDANETHTDYGIYTQHTATAGNVIITFASFTETALLQMAEQLTSTTPEQRLTHADLDVGDNALFFKVSGHNRTNIETNQVTPAPLDQTKIWTK